jgi:hypothetical protein
MPSSGGYVTAGQSNVIEGELAPQHYFGSSSRKGRRNLSLRHRSTVKTNAAVGLTTSELGPDAPFWIVAASPVLA